MSIRFTATYWLETPLAPERAAAIIAGEQSSGTFVKLENETDELLQRAGARVESLIRLDRSETPSLPGNYVDGAHFTRCHLTLSWPFESIGHSLPNLMATIAGNLFELQCVSGLRLLEVNLPDEMLAAQPGPQFGIEGTRKLTQVLHRPLIGTIIKPSVGLTPTQTAAEVKKLIDGGIDFIKDDELQADGPACPFEDRVRAVMGEINCAADRTGKKVMFAFNLTGEIDEMKRRHDFVLEHGGTCVMASLNSIGVAGVLALRRHSQMPIHAHRNGWGYLSRSLALGWDYAAWQKIMRLAGADHLHVNGIGNKFSESDASVIASARSVLTPLSERNPHACMPVFSSGQTSAQAAPTFNALQSCDLIFAAGGGIFGHPGGVRAGVEALREAWNEAMTSR